MKNIEKLKQLIDSDSIDYSLIDKITDESDDVINRCRIKFNNGLGLSIIKGRYSFGNEKGLFEIAVFDKNESINGAYLDEKDQGDSVLGYCDIEKVKYYIDKIGKLFV